MGWNKYTKALIGMDEKFSISPEIENGLLINFSYCKESVLVKQFCLSHLHVVCMANNKFAAVYLIERGADINCRTEHGETPLYFAKKHGDTELVRYMESMGAII